MGNVIISDTHKKDNTLYDDNLLKKYILDWALNNYTVNDDTGNNLLNKDVLKKRVCCTNAQNSRIDLPQINNDLTIETITVSVNVLSALPSVNNDICKNLETNGGNKGTFTGYIKGGDKQGVEASQQCQLFYPLFCENVKKYRSLNIKNDAKSFQRIYGPNVNDAGIGDANPIKADSYDDCACENSAFKADPKKYNMVFSNGGGSALTGDELAQNADARCKINPTSKYKSQDVKAEMFCMNYMGDLTANLGKNASYQPVQECKMESKKIITTNEQTETNKNPEKEYIKTAKDYAAKDYLQGTNTVAKLPGNLGSSYMPVKDLSTPVKPNIATPVKPNDATPVKPNIATPVKPNDATPVKPNIATPVKPNVATPVKPNVATPVKPNIATPVKPNVATPVKPNGATPVKPNGATPVKPNESTPVKPNIATPVKPNGAIPVKPNLDTKDKPNLDTKDKPNIDTKDNSLGKSKDDSSGKSKDDSSAKSNDSFMNLIKYGSAACCCCLFLFLSIMIIYIISNNKTKNGKIRK